MSTTLLEAARAAGCQHGKIAASWYFDGNTSLDEYRRVLRGIEEGDPEILDTFPSSPLSGEWAGDLTPDMLGLLFVAEDEETAEDVLSAFEDGFTTAAADEIERVAREHTATDIWTLLEQAPKGCQAVADLYHWSTNYDAGRGPFTLLLDLIGWSEDNIGQPLYSLREASLGYLELGKLAAALTEYADAPSDVRRYIDQLIEAEGS